MNSAWAVVVASIGGGLVAVVGSLGSVMVQQRRTDRREAAAARGQAYVALMARSLTLYRRVQTLLDATRLRTGLGEGFMVVLRFRKPVDPFELHDWLNLDMQPICEAWSAVLLIAPPVIAEAADKLMECSGKLIESQLQLPSAHGVAAVRRTLIGVRIECYQQQRIAAALEALGKERRAFSCLVRKENGLLDFDLPD